MTKINSLTTDFGSPQVVLSFVISVIATTTISTVIAILSGIVSDADSCLPVKFQHALSRSCSPKSKLRCAWVKNFLQRMLLGLADQQLVTGIALLIAGGIKWQQYDASTAASEIGFLSGAHAALIVYLSCLASSSHLAGILNLRSYFRKHRILGTVRICLVALFAVFLTVALRYSANAFGILAAYVDYPFEFISTVIPIWFPILLAVPILAILYTFWLALIQILDRPRLWIERMIRKKIWPFVRKWLGIWAALSLCRRILPENICNWCSRSVKSLFWFGLFGHPFFTCILQIIFTFLSVSLALLQKLIPSYFPDLPCDLTSPEENAWGFGQVLPMLLLLLPLLQAAELLSG